MGGRWQGMILAVTLLLAVAGPAFAAQPVDDPDAAAAWEEDVGQQRGWLARTLHRFFGRAPQTGDALNGRAAQTVDPFATHAGQPIEVILVNPVLRFAPEDTSATSGSVWLSSLARKVGSFTRNDIIKQYLLFAAGDSLDPYTLADSERLLRGLDYINDARIIVVPITGQETGVAVIVEYRDRWPFGATGKIKDTDRYETSLYTTNLGGLGVRFDNRIIHHNGREPHNGYHGLLSKENLFGLFLDAELEFEDSWQVLQRGGKLQRRNVHPEIQYVGGAAWVRTDDRDNEGVPRKWDRAEAWTGRVFKIDEDRSFRSGRRRTLSPAVGFTDQHFLDRPVTGPDTNRIYHDRRTWLVGLTYQRATDYETSYLFRMGEMEDIPGGMVISLSAGYEDGEHRDRTVGFLDTGGTLVRERGDVLYGNFSCGGYLRSRKFEDGLVDASLAYVTPLLGPERYQSRWYAIARYTLGVNRSTDMGLVLGDRSGLRGMSNLKVRGDQRVVLKMEHRLFTPWSLFGFRVMTFGYGDVGTIGDAGDPVFRNKVYSSLGLGVRLNNPDLVLPTIELRGGVLQNVDDRFFALAFDLGNLTYPALRLPGVKPGLVSFE